VDSNLVLDGFFSGCLEAPELCALAADEYSVSDIANKSLGLLEEVKARPFILGPSVSTDLVDFPTIKSAISQALYDTTFWYVSPEQPASCLPTRSFTSKHVSVLTDVSSAGLLFPTCLLEL
jgi:hypothetical protein